MSQLHQSHHPLVADRLSVLRDKATPTHIFRSCVQDISLYLAYEAATSLKLLPVDVTTPLCSMQGARLAHEKHPLLVPVLRAGLGLMAGFERLFPNHDVAHILIQRDEQTKLPHATFTKMPDPRDRPIFLLDPMLATAGSAIKAVDILVAHGAAVTDIRFVCLIAAPEGVKAFHAAYQDIPIYVGAVDDHLNAQAYIVPGLGDAGDRLFGT